MSISDAVTAYFWLFLAVWTASLVWSFVSPPTKPKKWNDQSGHDLTEIKIWPETLLRQGYDGGFQQFLHEPSGRSFKIRKYIHGKGDYGLELCVPVQSERSDIIYRSKQIAQAFGHTYRFELSDEGESSGSSGEILKIDCQQDPAATYNLICEVAREALGFTDQDRFSTKIARVSWMDDLIDTPIEPPRMTSLPTVKEVWANLDRRCRRVTSHPIRTHIAAYLWLLATIAAFAALPISMILSRGEAPEWSFELGEWQLSGSTESLYLFAFCIFCIPVMKMYRPVLRSKKDRPTPVYVWLPFRTLFFSLPVMTVLAWTGY